MGRFCTFEVAGALGEKGVCVLDAASHCCAFLGWEEGGDGSSGMLLGCSRHPWLDVLTM